MNFEKIPASYAQSRLWVLDNLIPDKAVYNVSIAYELTGNLNREALAFAMNELIKRHEILRTCYVYEGDTLWQIIYFKS